MRIWAKTKEFFEGKVIGAPGRERAALAEKSALTGSLTPGNDWRKAVSKTPAPGDRFIADGWPGDPKRASPAAPGDDEIVEAIAKVLFEGKLASIQPGPNVPLSWGDASNGWKAEHIDDARAILPIARLMILRQAAQAAPASAMRSAEELRAEIKRLGQAASFGGIGYLRALCWVLNEQETGDDG